MDDRLSREFLAETQERIEALFSDIEHLRRVYATDGRTRRALVARIFRHVHTLKGSAATVAELEAVGQLAHEFENLLDALRSGRVPLAEVTLDTCAEVTDALSLALESIARGDDAAQPSPSLLTQLRQHAATPQPSGESETAQPSRLIAALPEEITRPLSASERHRLTESVQEGARILLLDAAFDLATLEQRFSGFTAALGECGEVISTFPGVPLLTPDQISFRLLYTTNCAPRELEEHLAPFDASVAWNDIEPETGDAGAASADTGEEQLSERPGRSMKSDAAREPRLVRVPLQELDELVAATHELFTDTLATLEQALTIEHVSAGEAPLAGRAARLRKNFSALEDRVLALRMQPLWPVLERAARGARMAARAAGKEIDFEVAGGEVRLDRSLAEQIGEPLLHLLRNAIDHGIESSEERRAAGKPERGRVRLEVAAEGSRVRLCVTDDGRGIDTERVARAAAAQGLIEAGAYLTDQQALRLIFRPGFSTAGQVSAVSGRGVGLDVVEHASERIGGELRVRTVRGRGTTFELRVPLALALVSVVMVRAGGHAYAIDARHVVETICLKASDMAAVGVKYETRWGGRLLPHVSLRALLGQAETGAKAGETVPVLIARLDRDGADEGPGAPLPEQLIIIVDELDGEREALVRSLGSHATRWRGVGGAIEQRDGTIALLLDLPQLWQSVSTIIES